MYDRDVLLMIYQVKANHIDSLKSGQWRNAYYTILSQSGIVGISELFKHTAGLPDIAPGLLPISLIICIASLTFAAFNIRELMAERRDQKKILRILSPSIQREFAEGQMLNRYGSVRYELPYAFVYMLPVLVAEVFVFWYLAPPRALGPLLSILFASIVIFVFCLIVRRWTKDC